MGDPELARDFAEDIVLLKQVGIRPVVVHGGGPQIGAMLKRLGVESRFVDGLRVTDAATAEVAEMVLGSINKELVRWISGAGGKAVGLSGKDAGLITAEKVTRTARDPGSAIEQAVDLGFVGEPARVDRHVLDVLNAADIIPVVAPIGAGADGHTYNINADTCAGAIAAALGAARFFLLTDVPGVLAKDGSLLTDLTPEDVARLEADGTISGGMIPKLETCVAAVNGGVDAAVILDGRVPHAMLLEIFTRRGAGTLVRRHS
jgi:acetylglutamate kinase